MRKQKKGDYKNITAPGEFAMMFEAQFPWLEDPDKKTHACPDAFNPVVFEITRIREK